MPYTLDDIDTISDTDYNKFYRYLIIGTSLGKGRGIFAGRNFRKNQIVEIAPYIGDTSSGFQDYIFLSHLPQYESVLALGYGSIYNHSNDPNVKYTLLSSNDKIENAYFVYYANRDIPKGGEMLISYGRGWWRSRNLAPKIPNSDSDSDVTDIIKKKYLRR